VGHAEPAPGEALIRPLRLAVAAPDRAAARGQLPHRGTLGHLFVGIVERVKPGNGPARDDLSLWMGKRVIGSPVISCGSCARCKGGLSHHCSERTVLGLHNRDGCFAERFTIPVSNLVEVPKSLDDERAALAGLVAAAAHAAGLARIEGKQYVTVLGDGPVGLLCAQIATRMNASVRLLGHHAEKLALCERWGIKHRIESEAGRRADQDLVIDCTGSSCGLALAMRLVRPRGKIVLKTALAPTPFIESLARPDIQPLDLSPIVCNELELLGASGGRIAEGLDAITRLGVDVLPLITLRTKFDSLAAGLNETSGLVTLAEAA
jgi:threonine dehydrogenase-like Zn-dependent dehydrogenase